MTILRITNPTGEIPRLPPRLLPDNAATLAVNCDFSHGEIRSVQGIGPMKRTSDEARSVFSDDGLRFFAWSEFTRCFLAPTIDDIYDRVYFENAKDGFRVTRSSQMQLANYRPPNQHWRIGMPVPTAADAAFTLVDADLSAKVALRLEYIDGSVEDIPLRHHVPVIPGRKYILYYDASSSSSSSSSSSQGIFDGSGYATLTGVDFVERNPRHSSDVRISWSYDGNRPILDGNPRISRLANWNVFSGSYSYLEISGFPYKGIKSSDPDWFLPYTYTLAIPENDADPTYETRHDYVEALEVDPPLSIRAKNLGNNSLECTYDISGSSKTTILTNVVSVKHNGTWKNLGDAASPGDSSGAQLHAVVSGKIAGEDYVAATAGSLTMTTNDAVTVTLVEESPGEVWVTITYASAEASDVSRNAAYVATFVNEWGEESAPTPPIILARDVSTVVRVESHYQAFPDGKPAIGMNVYRTYATGDAYLLINPTPIGPQGDGTWLFHDASESPQTATALVSAEWDPPHPNLRSLTYVGNGFFAGAVGKDLVFSEPYHPHAWPYAMTFPQAIMGMEVVENGLLVTTLSRPYIVYGAHPEQMTQQIINTEQAGIAQRAMTRVEGNAAYVSNDGIIEVSGGLANIASSRNLFTRQDWRDRYLPNFRSMVLGAHDGAIVGIIDPDFPGAHDYDGFVIRLDERPRAAIRAWDSESTISPSPSECRSFRKSMRCLPSIPPQKTWAVEFSGTGTLRRFEMASSFAELKGV
jgi:hypothetical protein